MTSCAPSRSRRRIAAASACAAIALTMGALAVSLNASLLQTWWPRTGQAFTTGASRQGGQACAWIAGPAKTYCEHEHRRTRTTPVCGGGEAVAWMLVPAAVVGALVIGRHRAPRAEGRR
ncbi:hypothetical protein ACF08B_39460 [Streptomyces sp. NPDC015139]|uniref:hypothetical protein n=1 Tax=Streptomyces sp. NPDC015139 TaxID=3364942 RepID=UPI0036FC3D25